MHATYNQQSDIWDNNQNYHQWDAETEAIGILLQSLKPDFIISAMRGNFEAQVYAHFELITYIMKNECRLLFLSSANVFDAFTNFPSHEYDKTLSLSVYGRFKIKIENALLRLPNHKYIIARLPMVYGLNSPRIKEMKTLYDFNEAFEVFPNVILNATTISKLTQQIHFMINQDLEGVFHLGSKDLIHHIDLIGDICKRLNFQNPLLKKVFSSNEDRFLAVLPKDNLLPQNLQIDIEQIVEESILL